MKKSVLFVQNPVVYLRAGDVQSLNLEQIGSHQTFNINVQVTSKLNSSAFSSGRKGSTSKTLVFERIDIKLREAILDYFKSLSVKVEVQAPRKSRLEEAAEADASSDDEDFIAGEESAEDSKEESEEEYSRDTK